RFLHELEDISSRLAAEAVIELALRVHRERGRLLLVEGAEPGPVPTHALQRHRLSDDFDDVAGRAHALDPVIGAARAPRGARHRSSRHGPAHLSLTIVTPRPPSPTAPRRWDATCGWPVRWRPTASLRSPLPTPWMMRSSFSP